MSGGARKSARLAGGVRRWEAFVARHTWVQTMLVVLRRDVEIGGSLLAGALAFRLFVWLLPCCLLMAALLGFTASNGYPIEELARERGLGPFTASALDQVASQAERGRYVTGLLGLVLLLAAGLSLGRALDRVHNRIWRDVLDPRVKPTVFRTLRYSAVLLLIVLGNCTAPLVTTATRVSAVLITIPTFVLHVVLVAVLFSADWPPRWRLNLPGAALVALGVAGLNLVSVLYLPHKLARASELYGTLGVAATMLVWLALVARLLVLGQVVNVAWLEARNRP